MTVLALGIGANTAIFSLVNAMLLRAAGLRGPSEIVQLFSQDKKNPKSFRAFSYPTYCDIRDQNDVFTGVLAHNTDRRRPGEKENTRRVMADIVSSNYFSCSACLPPTVAPFCPTKKSPVAANGLRS